MANNDKIRSSASGVLKRFYDNFARSDSSLLSTAANGSKWKQIRGTFGILGSSASASSSDYSITAAELPFSDVKIELSDISQGAGASLWVTDSGNWWAIGVETHQQQQCQTCYTCNATSTGCNGNWEAECASYYISGYYTYTTVNTCSYYFCYTYYGAPNAKYGYRPPITNCATNYYTCYQNVDVPVYSCGSYYPPSCTGNTYEYCSSASPYNCNCTYIYPSYIKLIKSVSNVITEVASWAISAAASSLRIKTSGSQITAQAYSDGSLSSQIGSDIVYTPSGVTITPQYGLAVKPSPYNQGYSIGSVDITKN